MLLPYQVKDFHPDWCSFGWFLGWALDRFFPATCRYLEWGPGWSTKYVLLSGLLNTNIFSVESEEQYYQKYLELNVNLILRGGPKTEEVCETVERTWYDPFPGNTFDIILVDGGHKRDECVSQAARMLSPNGFVIVHDTLTCKEHRRASIGTELSVVAENLVPPGTTLMCRQSRHISVQERFELTYVNFLSRLVFYERKVRSKVAGLQRRINRTVAKANCKLRS